MRIAAFIQTPFITHDDKNQIRIQVADWDFCNPFRVTIASRDQVLYDGLMKDCTAVTVSVTASAQTVTPIYYRITVYTNGAEVGNEYMGESLTADFSWQLH